MLGATRLTVAATSVGRARRVLDAATEWAANRRQFGQPIKRSPAWLRSDRYTIDARAAGPESIAMMRGPMMQALLEDRFKLKIHREDREVPVYELTLAKGRSKLRRAKEGSCIPQDRREPTAVPLDHRATPVFHLCTSSPAEAASTIVKPTPPSARAT